MPRQPFPQTEDKVNQRTMTCIWAKWRSTNRTDYGAKGYGIGLPSNYPKTAMFTTRSGIGHPWERRIWAHPEPT